MAQMPVEFVEEKLMSTAATSDRLDASDAVDEVQQKLEKIGLTVNGEIHRKSRPVDASKLHAKLMMVQQKQWANMNYLRYNFNPTGEMKRGEETLVMTEDDYGIQHNYYDRSERLPSFFVDELKARNEQ